MSILTRADGYRAAQYTGTPSSADDSTMDEIIDAVDRVVGVIAGADRASTSVQSFTTQCQDRSLLLPWRFTSVSSVVVDGVTLDPTSYDAFTGRQVGILRAPLDAGVPWASGTAVTVTATVGVASVDGGVRQGAMFLAGHLWQILQQGGRGAYADEIAGMSAGYAIPNRARELLELDGGALAGFA